MLFPHGRLRDQPDVRPQAGQVSLHTGPARPYKLCSSSEPVLFRATVRVVSFHGNNSVAVSSPARSSSVVGKDVQRYATAVKCHLIMHSRVEATTRVHMSGARKDLVVAECAFLKHERFHSRLQTSSHVRKSTLHPHARLGSILSRFDKTRIPTTTTKSPKTRYDQPFFSQRSRRLYQ